MAQIIPKMGHTFDIASFLWRYRCFLVLVEPFRKLDRFFYDTIRWKNPRSTITVWLIVNMLTIVIATEYTLVVCLALLVLMAVLGLFHHYTQVFAKFFPDQELESNRVHAYVQRKWGDEQNILDEYRTVLIKIDATFDSINSCLEKMFRILKWDDPKLSIRWFLGSAILISSCFLLDPRHTLFLLNNAVIVSFACSKIRGRHVRFLVKIPSDEDLVVENEDLSSPKVKNTSNFRMCSDAYSSKRSNKIEVETNNSNNHPKGNGFQLEIASTQDEPFIDDKENKLTDSDPEDIDAGDVDDNDPDLETTLLAGPGDASPGRNRPNVVRKLMVDLRRRRQQGAGFCAGCQSPFTAILKRRHDCANCGNHFCSRCCSVKVPKSTLGVTAPATKNDVVLVCSPCHRYLVCNPSPGNNSPDLRNPHNSSPSLGRF